MTFSMRNAVAGKRVACRMRPGTTFALKHDKHSYWCPRTCHRACGVFVRTASTVPNSFRRGLWSPPWALGSQQDAVAHHSDVFKILEHVNVSCIPPRGCTAVLNSARWTQAPAAVSRKSRAAAWLPHHKTRSIVCAGSCKALMVTRPRVTAARRSVVVQANLFSRIGRIFSSYANQAGVVP